MTLSPAVLTRAIREAQRPVGVKELMRLTGLNPGQQTEVKRVLRELLRAGGLVKDGKRFALPGKQPRLSEPVPAPAFAKGGRKSGRQGGKGERSEGHGGHGRPAESSRGGKHPGADRRSGRFDARSGGRRPLAQDSVILEGTLSLHRDGFGFVRRSDGEGDDVFIPPQEARKALGNDKVRIEVVPSDGGRTEGHILEVLSRRREQAVGTYRYSGGDDALVVPSDASLPGPIRVPPTQLAVDGDLVKVQLGVGAELLTRSEGLVGEVTGTLGRPGDPSGEVLSIVYAQGFKEEFPADVMAQADKVPLKVSEAEATAEGRRDLRTMELVTIDGEDARDFDDAVYAEPAPDGTRLVVAIADVTHYVREHTPLDVEAFARATSVYLPNRVLPMLPERLSAGICSLKPDEDRLCMVSDMVFDADGALVRDSLYPAVMRSAARCTYNEVQAVLDGEDLPHRVRFRPHFQRLWALAQTLNKKRVARGAIDFDIPETRVLIGKDGLPERMERRERKDAHRLIEECMLAANEAVAAHFQSGELPTIYRFHGPPDEDKLEKFASLARAHGFNLRAEGGEISSKMLADLVRQMEGHPEQRALNQLLLRSMMQAIYSSENVGHYGLAAEHYLHFTSPIRRYPDLIVHRQLKREWARGNHRPSQRELDREAERLEEQAVQSSERERAAMLVEREVTAFYATLLMKERLGETFSATVSSVTDFGFFVELDKEFVEGLVKAETVGTGARFDAALNALTFASGRKIRVGDRLTVRLTGASLERRQLDFSLIAFEGEEPEPVAAERSGFERLRHRRPMTEAPPPGRSRPPAPGHRERTRESSPERTFRRAPPPPVAHPVRPAHRVEPAFEPPAASSPHPGFDRLRALAARGKSAALPASRGAQEGRSRMDAGPREPERGQPHRGGPRGKPSPRGGGSEGGGRSGSRPGARGGPKGRSKRR